MNSLLQYDTSDSESPNDDDPPSNIDMARTADGSTSSKHPNIAQHSLSTTGTNSESTHDMPPEGINEHFSGHSDADSSVSLTKQETGFNFFSVDDDSDEEECQSLACNSNNVTTNNFPPPNTTSGELNVITESRETRVEMLTTLPNTPFWKGERDHILTSRRTAEVIQKRVGVLGNQTWLKRTHTDVSSTTDSPSKHGKYHHGITLHSLPTKPMFSVHPSVAPHLSQHQISSELCKNKSADFMAHNGIINSISWCKCLQHSNLLLTASMDKQVKIWDGFSKVTTGKCLQTLTVHSKAVKCARWTSSGRQVVSCGYDKTSKLCDAETGKLISSFQDESFVTALAMHPIDPSLFVTGSHNSIKCWDCRESKYPTRSFNYKETFGQVRDLVFTTGGTECFSCNDLVSRDSADRNIMAWDFASGAVLSNQIYQERYTCTKLKVHPTWNILMAQTNGDYIASFSTKRPYKMDKCKRYQGHKVVGYNVGFDISPDGRLVVSGSSDGKFIYYDYKHGRKLKQFDCENSAILDVEFHPVLNSTLAVSSWSGGIQIWQ